jgi:uncharacterized protein YhaN
MKILKIISALIISLTLPVKADNFTQKDRELLINLSMQVSEIKGELKNVDKRLDQIDKRIDQVDKRIDQVDKRIDQVDKSVNQLYTFLWILTGIFTPITVALISLVIRELAKEDPKVATVLKRFNLL